MSSGSGGSSGGTGDGVGGDDISTKTGCTGGETKTNSKGESYCLNCGSPSHWAYECPQLRGGEQQAQLHMTVEVQEEGDEEQAQEGHQLLNVTLAQRGALPDDGVYLEVCYLPGGM